MKKLFFSIIAIVCSTIMFSQEYVVNVCEDKIENKTYYLATDNILVKNEKGTMAFLITLHFSKEADELVCKAMSVKSVVGSDCVENSVLYFVLENDEVLTFNAWNKFNCKGTSYFDIDKNQAQLLSTFKINTIRFKNGKDFASLTGMEKGKENIFIRVYNNLVLKNITCNQ